MEWIIIMFLAVSSPLDNNMIAIALAQDLQRDGDIENAIRTAEHSLVSGGQDVDTLFLLSNLHREAGNTNEAELFQKRAKAAEDALSAD